MRRSRFLQSSVRRPLILARVVFMIVGPALHGCAEVDAEDDAVWAEPDEHDDHASHDSHDSHEAKEPAVLSLTAAATTPSWTRCANEFGYCSFSGLRDVRMRTADGRSVTREFYQTARCGTDAEGFGADPAPGVGKYCEVGPAKYTSLPAPDKAMGPAIDLSQIPRGFPGYSTFRVRPNGTAPRKDTIGAFRTVCSLSHMNFDDPLVFPGNPGAAHLHAFFGNTLTTASSTASSLATTGSGSCRGGTANRTAYWVPALIDTKDGKPVIPYEGHFYYKTGYAGIAPASVLAMPKGLRMIAGSATASGPQQVVTWGCIDGNSSGPAIQNCGVGQQLQLSVTFPQCWNGRDLDAPDHKSHMAYPANGKCPTTHPKPLPEISFHVRYKVEELNAPLRWRLSSDMYDSKLPGGYSGHGDWWDGWNEDVKNSFIQGCNNKSLDCYSNLLGDGREIY